MSSPKVLVGVPAPLEEANRVNRAHAKVYLELAQVLYDRLLARSEALRASGVAAPAQPQTPEMIARLVAAEMDASRSWPGLQIAHAYWQSLKHEFGDALDELQARVLAEQSIQKATAAAADVQRRERVARSMAVTIAPIAGEKLAGVDASAGIDRVAERVAGVLAAAESAGEDAREAIERTTRGARSIDERCVALDVLRAGYGERATRARRAAAMERLAAERQARERDDARTWIAALHVELGGAGERDIADLGKRLETFEAALERLDSTALETELDALRTAITHARSRKSTFDLVASTLRRQGYEEVSLEMQTLTPQQIRRYYRDPVDDEHLVAVDASAEGSTVAIEALRIAGTGGAGARRADRETQQRLCNTLASLHAHDEAAWRIETIADVAPGSAMRERLDLAAALPRSGRAKRTQYFEARP